MASGAPSVSYLFFNMIVGCLGQLLLQNVRGLLIILTCIVRSQINTLILRNPIFILISNNTEVEDWFAFCQKLGVLEVLDLGKYFASVGRNKAMVFNPLPYKIWTRISAWST